MKKLLCALSLAATVAAQAATGDYMLYWQVSDDISTTVGSDVYYADLYAVIEGNGVRVGSTYSSGNKLGTVPATAANLANWSDSTISSFYVEYFGYGGTTLFGQSDAISYADAAAAGYITDFRDSYNMMTASSAWSVTGFSAVPEPTSGLLMLLGLAGLALKRKRA